jgi:ATP phosphoribosyltransferase
LQGPTLSPVVARESGQPMFAAQIVVRRDQLIKAIAELRTIGGSGVVVTPVTYIFEEEPARIKAVMDAVNRR